MSEGDRVERVLRVQEHVQAFLTLTFPFTSIDVIVAALSYEIARVIGTHPSDSTDDELIADVVAIMKEQIAAHRSGRLPPT